MAQCRAIKRDGGRCTASVPPGVEWCFNHDPARSEERRRNAARAGRSSGGGEIKAISGEVKALIEEVRRGDLATGRAAVMIQGYNCLLRAEEAARRVRETEELAAQVEELRRELA